MRKGTPATKSLNGTPATRRGFYFFIPAANRLPVAACRKLPLIASLKGRLDKYIPLSDATSNERSAKQATMKDQEQTEGGDGAYGPQDADFAKRRNELVPAGGNRGEGNV